MATPQHSFAEALRAAHHDLFHELQELEHAVTVWSRESPGELASRLEKARLLLADHFRFEEDGGYMAPVLKEEPRFARVIQELLAEHGQMAQALEALIQEVKHVSTTQAIPREKIRAWVGQVRHHESRENNLVQEAYYASGATGD